MCMVPWKFQGKHAQLPWERDGGKGWTSVNKIHLNLTQLPGTKHQEDLKTYCRFFCLNTFLRFYILTSTFHLQLSSCLHRFYFIPDQLERETQFHLLFSKNVQSDGFSDLKLAVYSMTPEGWQMWHSFPPSS